MPGYFGKATNNPEDSVGQMAQGERDTIWGPIPGEIIEYNASKGTATIRPLYKPKVNGQTLTMPDLYEVPVDQPAHRQFSFDNAYTWRYKSYVDAADAGYRRL
jgi:hypothetical protein